MAELSHPVFEDEAQTPWALIALWASVGAVAAALVSPWACYTPLPLAALAGVVAVFAALKSLATPDQSREARHAAVAAFVLGAMVLVVMAIVALFVGMYVALIAVSIASGL